MDWGCALALGVLCTAAAYLLFFHLLANVGATAATAVTFLIPVFAIHWGWIWLNEAITARLIVGTLITLGAPR